jgi:hypothetical protein
MPGAIRSAQRPSRLAAAPILTHRFNAADIVVQIAGGARQELPAIAKAPSIRVSGKEAVDVARAVKGVDGREAAAE